MKSVLLGMRKNGRLLALLVLCLVGAELAANEYKIKWDKHKDTTCTDATIAGWHTTGTGILKTDNDGAGTADVACDTTLTKNGDANSNCSYKGGDQLITSTDELDSAAAGMDEGVVGAVVSSIVIGGDTWRGASNGTKIVISASAVKGSTLAHEVGHIAKNADLDPTITMRIMNKTTGGDENRVNCNERDKYLALK